MTRRPRARESMKSGLPAWGANSLPGAAFAGRGAGLRAMMVCGTATGDYRTSCTSMPVRAIMPPFSGGRMAEWLSLAEAIAANVRDGDLVAMEGFTHLIPFAAGHEIMRQRRRKLSLVRMTPDLIYDQLIGAGCAGKLTFSWGGNPGVGSLHRFRDAVENGWPRPLQIEERSHSDLANAYVAGAANLPFAVLRGYTGSDLVRFNPQIRTITCPFTGEQLAATP